MSIQIAPLTSTFGARLVGLDITTPLTDQTFAEVRAALDEHSLLIVPGQPITDDQQVAFSERFGSLERTISASPSGGTYFARQSNIDAETGNLIQADDRRMRYQKANLLWHADSTYKETSSLCSILSTRVVPPGGGDTEFASTRAAHEALPEARRAELAPLEVEHDLLQARRKLGFHFTRAESAETPPVRHPLVRTNPTTGRKSLMIGAHAVKIIGWPDDEGRALLDELLEIATATERCYRHAWSPGDLAIWDNRACLHRATAYEATRYPRLMQRTTVSDPDTSSDRNAMADAARASGGSG